MTDLLIFIAILAAWLLLSPCSRFSVWKGASCAWKPAPRPAEKPGQERDAPPTP